MVASASAEVRSRFVASEGPEDRRPVRLRWHTLRGLAGHDSKVGTAGCSPHCSAAQWDGRLSGLAVFSFSSGRPFDGQLLYMTP